MVSWKAFENLSLENKIKMLYEEASFVVGIRYYSYKVNLYLLGNEYVEVFYNHKRDAIERIHRLDIQHTRMKFYTDQIKIHEISLS
jgi:hypothetical protein